MDLVAGVRKEGSRGGRADFKWSDVQTDQHRENYLGHSLMAPVGRWQKRRDLSWYAKADDGTAVDAAEKARLERAEEMRLIKQAEQEALSKALGYEINPLGPLGSGAGTGANAIAVPRNEMEDLVKEKEGTEGMKGRTVARTAIATDHSHGRALGVVRGKVMEASTTIPIMGDARPQETEEGETETEAVSRDATVRTDQGTVNDGAIGQGLRTSSLGGRGQDPGLGNDGIPTAENAARDHTVSLSARSCLNRTKRRERLRDDVWLDRRGLVMQIARCRSATTTTVSIQHQHPRTGCPSAFGPSDLIGTAMALSVNGKSALVTGAGSGICLEFARLLLSKGCNVVFADIALRPEAQDVVSAHKDATKARAIFSETDVTSWAQLDRAIAAGVQAFGAIDIFCPGAGVFEPPFSNFWYPPGSSRSKDEPDSDRYKLLDINLTHPIRLTQLAIAHLLSRRSTIATPTPSSAPPPALGSIVLISSIAAQRASLPFPVYGASKAAISAFTRSLALLETSVGIRLTAVAPGLVRTPLFLDNPERLALVDQEKDVWVTPEEVAQTMLDCIEGDKWKGGSVVEVGSKQTRLVESLNDPGPSGEGFVVGLGMTAVDEVFEVLKGPAWGARQ